MFLHVHAACTWLIEPSVLHKITRYTYTCLNQDFPSSNNQGYQRLSHNRTLIKKKEEKSSFDKCYGVNISFFSLCMECWNSVEIQLKGCEIFYSYFALWDILQLLCIVRYFTATLHFEIFCSYFALLDILQLLCILRYFTASLHSAIKIKREREKWLSLKRFFGPSLVEIGQVIDSVEKDKKVKFAHWWTTESK